MSLTTANFEHHMRKALGEYALKTTGVSDQKRKDPLGYVTTIFGRLRNVEFLKQLHTDCEHLCKQKPFHDDSSVEHTLIACFTLIVDRLAQDSFDEITFSAVRKCFLSIMAEIDALKEADALNILQPCVEVQAGELLVLQAYHEIEQAPMASGAINNWMSALIQHTGISSQERIERYTISLVEKQLLQLKSKNDIKCEPMHELTEIGSAVADSIRIGTKIIQSM